MEYWKLCSSCKKEIGFETKYYKCSVSTCNGDRTGYVFCSMQCFESHIPGARHRDAGAIISASPSKGSTNSNTLAVTTSTPTRRIITSSPNLTSSGNFQNASSQNSANEDEILVVVSKLKKYVSDKSEMNTSGDVAEILSHMIRRLCDEAVDHARQDGRKTLMARDFKK